MSTYLRMWQAIKSLTRQERNDWIRLLSPARGVGVDFEGVECVDVDLLEALRNYNDRG